MIDLMSLAEPAAPAAPDTPGGAVYRRFQREPDTMVIAVVDAGRPVGLVERNAFTLSMAAEYGRALHANRPVALMMNRDPLITDGAVRVMDFFGQVLAERPSELLNGFIVVRDGVYAGVGSLMGLLQATNRSYRARAEELAELAARLDVARLEAQAALHAKSQFLAVMSHEIRTPLNGVLSIADILTRKLSQHDLVPYVGAIRDSGETLLRLLNDTLDLSRAETGRLDLNDEPFEVSRLVQEAGALWSARAAEKGLDLRLAFEGPQDLWALGDLVRLKQVFNNLIGNALKFTEAGHVEISLTADVEDIYVKLSARVADTGPGVADGSLEGIFQPFAQDDGGRRLGGAGLGLAICRQIVERMDGSIHAEPNPGGGLAVCFGVTLFHVLGETAAGPTEAADLDLKRALHVLIADDNATNRLVAGTLVEMFGCTFDAVEDGRQALEAAEGGRFDLILMDIKMPVMDGAEAARAIRALGGPVSTIPIIALTANADPWDAAAYLADGMNAVVEKPIRPEALMEAINTALSSVVPLTGSRDVA